MNTLLWLDDIRDPFENEGEWLIFSPISNPYSVHWVKSMKEFVEWILTNDLPTAICFDHDLGGDEETSKLEPSGFDCAKWLVDYCIDNDEELPKWNVQSANPVGKDNINGLLISYLKFSNK
jgi:hypothetical protein